MKTYLNSLYSEWLKTKRSAASWLSVIGGFFIPTIFLLGQLKNQVSIGSPEAGPYAWSAHFIQLWQSMSSFLLPMGVILASSLITQLEYKNNTWKQLHTTPQSFTVVFAAKFSVLMLMTLKFFIFFNIGIILSGIIPCLVLENHFPKQDFPYELFMKGNLKFFITCLPILAIQYLLSLQFKNFLVPIGAGLLGLIGTLIALRWNYIYLSPYAYGQLGMMRNRIMIPGVNIFVLAFICFTLIMLLSYMLYIRKKEKG